MLATPTPPPPHNTQLDKQTTLLLYSLFTGISPQLFAAKGSAFIRERSVLYIHNKSLACRPGGPELNTGLRYHTANRESGNRCRRSYINCAVLLSRSIQSHRSDEGSDFIPVTGDALKFSFFPSFFLMIVYWIRLCIGLGRTAVWVVYGEIGLDWM